jgi:glycerophosphoryl diester phosphodiesterase
LENTREGFQYCASIGCDAVELDVFELKCGTIVVFHGSGSDENPGQLLEYCNIDGSILDLTYEQVQKSLTFNPDHPEFKCPTDKILNARIPTLEEVLLDNKQQLQSQARLKQIKIELKGGPSIVEKTLQLIDTHDMVDQTAISSFNMEYLKLVRQLKPEKCPTSGNYRYKTGALFNDEYTNCIEIAKQVGANEIHLRYDTCTVDLINQIHDSGFGSMAWFRGPVGMEDDCTNKYYDVGNEDETMYETLLGTGVQEMCINRPDVLVRLRERLRQREEQQIQQQLCDDDTAYRNF